MKHFKLLVAAAVVGMAAVVAAMDVTDAAAATSAVTVTSVNMRAGPSTQYPVVVKLTSGTALVLYGCTADTTWCDISWGRNRGWVAANYVQVLYRGNTVMVTPALAPMIGLTVVAFNQVYWNTYYVGRPWYNQWDVYYRPGRPGPRPPTRAAAGCNGSGCGAAVIRPGQVKAGHCADGTCTGTAVNKGPNGRVWVRRGSTSRN